MNVVVVLAHRFNRTPDGRVWTQAMFAYPFWTRYLDVFNNVRVVARAFPVKAVPEGAVRADGEGVTFADVVHYAGLRQYLGRVAKVRRSVQQAIGEGDAVILRVGCQLASCLEPLLRRTGRPYGVEVVSDAYELFGPGCVGHPLRPVFRRWFARRERVQIAGSAAVSYVTESVLQRRYPAPVDAYSTHYSSVELPAEAFVTVPRTAQSNGRPVQLVTVGSLAQRYKGVDTLIEAFAACLRDGLDLRLKVVGDGRHRAELEARARASGAHDRIHFLGKLTAGEPVRRQFDRADLFVLPSRTEGLPRAMIEAMARALPCIGTRVGGVSELLGEENLIPPDDPGRLAAKIREVVSDPTRMSQMSARNLRKAAEYQDDVLRDRRVQFYQAVRDRTENWLQASCNKLPQTVGPASISSTGQ